MATLKAVVRKQRSDGFYPVYIRVSHRTKVGYIKTSKIISPSNITKSGDFTDAFVNEHCARLILQYNDKLNRKDLKALSVAEVVEYLTRDSEAESFSEYSQLHIRRLEERGQAKTAKNYILAVQHLERYLGSNQLLFCQLSSTVLK